jgi:voltage-gated sodium channel
VSGKSVETEESASRKQLAGGTKITRSLHAIVASKAFDIVVTGVILLQAIVLALEAMPSILPPESTGVPEAFRMINHIVIGVFIVEAAIKMAALYPRPQAYFRDGWNNFDFGIIILSLLPMTGEFYAIARLVRLLRITHLVTKSKELRVLVSTLLHSIPSIFNILILLGMLFFIYSIIGFHLFKDIDPGHWADLPTSFTTLFEVLTLEEWVAVTQPIEETLGPIYWVYFASFILIGTFIIINLFISVIVRKSEEAHRRVEEESAMPLTQREIMHEIKEIRKILGDLEKRLPEGALDAADEKNRKD